MIRTIERLLLIGALAAAAGGLYLAVDARKVSNSARRQVLTAREDILRATAGFHPTLVVQQRSDDPFEAPRVPPGGEL
jgi:hypothetical protein